MKALPRGLEAWSQRKMQRQQTNHNMSQSGPVLQRRSSASTVKSPVVIPSSDLDTHLHSMATEITKRRHSKQKELVIASPDVCLNGGHDNDLMTPPDVLLESALKQAEKHVTQNNKDAAVTEWTRCTALARIVHGDSHWAFANTHIQLGKTYSNKGLIDQALIHASKGRDILLAPGSHVMSHDPIPEAVHCLSTAHCIIGRVLTERGSLPEAEKTLLKAERCSERLSQLPGDNADVQLDLDIVSSLGRLCLKQGKLKLASDCLSKAIDLSKAAFGATNGRLVSLLRGLATAQLQQSDQSGALESLDEALQIAKENFGEDSEDVAEVLVGTARASLVAEEDRSGTTSVEEMLRKAHTIYSSSYNSNSEKAIACKEELCRVLSAKKDSQEKAIPLLKELIAEKRHTFGDQSAEVAHSLKLLGTVYLMQGKVTQAKKQLEKAQDAFSYSLGAKHKETVHLNKTLAVISGSSNLSSKELSTAKPLFKTVV